LLELIYRLIDSYLLERAAMSRRENYWDNSPQESFFGHFKDETDMKSSETLKDVKKKIKSYMIYYNYYHVNGT